jgi:alpha-tubulin suppressor-like RCC1 family protein
MRVLHLAPIACLLATFACTRDTISPLTGELDLRLIIVSGDNQTGVAGSALAAPLVAKVVDANNLPVKGQVVNFVVTAGDGSVFGGSEVTGTDGVVRERWTLGTVAGLQTIEARYVNSKTGAPVVAGKFKATARGGPGTQVSIVSGDGQVLHAGSYADTLVAKVFDKYGNVAAPTSVTWKVLTGSGSITVLNAQSSNAGISRGRLLTSEAVGYNRVRAAVSGGTTIAMFRVIGVSESETMWQSIAGGQYDTCGLTASGYAHCWGANFIGTLGVNSTNTDLVSPMPAQVSGGDTYTSLSGGVGMYCATTSGGVAKCWGRNPNGGIGATATASCLPAFGSAYPCNPAPTSVASELVFQQLSPGGYHSCGISDSKLYCWGRNNDGQRGDADVADGATVRAVEPALNFISVAAGFLYTCAVKSDGGVYCFGRNDWGQSGIDNDGADVIGPTLVTLPEAATSVAANWEHTCAIGVSGAVYCWGANFGAQLGNGSDADGDAHPTPVQVSGSWTFSSITVGEYHSCGITTDGTAMCWGDASVGEIGFAGPFDTCSLFEGGLFNCARTPFAVGYDVSEPLRQWVLLAAGRFHTCGITVEGEAFCWGEGASGQIGNGGFDDVVMTPVKVGVPPAALMASAQRPGVRAKRSGMKDR